MEPAAAPVFDLEAEDYSGAAFGDEEMSFSDLNAALDMLQTKLEAAGLADARRAGVSTTSKASKTPAASSFSTAQAAVFHNLAARQPALPAFYLWALMEDELQAESGSSAASEAGGAAAAMAAYPSSGGMERGGEDCSVVGAAEGSGGAEAPEVWAGERYEPDAVLQLEGRSGGPDSAFIKFTKRLQRCPEQCARYRCVRICMREGVGREGLLHPKGGKDGAVQQQQLLSVPFLHAHGSHYPSYPNNPQIHPWTQPESHCAALGARRCGQARGCLSRHAVSNVAARACLNCSS